MKVTKIVSNDAMKEGFKMYTIKIKVDEEKDLYNSFDADDVLLSEDVKSYITGRLVGRKLGDHVEIMIVSSNPIDKDRLRKAFHTWNTEEEQDIKREYRRNILQQFWMFVVGVVFIALSLFFEDKVGMVWYTVLSTIGAFSMWEAASILIIQNPRLRMRKKITKAIGKNARIKYFE